MSKLYCPLIHLISVFKASPGRDPDITPYLSSMHSALLIKGIKFIKTKKKTWIIYKLGLDCKELFSTEAQEGTRKGFLSTFWGSLLLSKLISPRLVHGPVPYPASHGLPGYLHGVDTADLSVRMKGVKTDAKARQRKRLSFCKRNDWPALPPKILEY